MTRCEPSMLTCLSIPHNINCTGSYKLKAKLICLYAVNLSHLTQIGDKMCDTGALHLPIFLDKTIIYGYLKAERKDEDENVIHYSTFCYLLRNVFPFVKIPKVM